MTTRQHFTTSMLSFPRLIATSALLLMAITAQATHGQEIPVAPEPTDLPPITTDEDGCPSPEEAQRQFRSLAQIRVGMQLEGKELPPDCSGDVFQGKHPAVALSDSITEFNWAAINFFHQPLYFDDTPLERYGQSICPHFQPVISGGRFVLTLPIMPYKIGYDHPYDCVSILGHYRPGVCAPCVMQVPPPLQLHSALLQAGTTVALAIVVP
jgi:hypothetical protein